MLVLGGAEFGPAELGGALDWCYVLDGSWCTVTAVCVRRRDFWRNATLVLDKLLRKSAVKNVQPTLADSSLPPTDAMKAINAFVSKVPCNSSDRVRGGACGDSHSLFHGG